MDPRERHELVQELLDRLAERGVPQGTWLVDIGVVRAALRQADRLLLALEDALVSSQSVEER